MLYVARFYIINRAALILKPGYPFSSGVISCQNTDGGIPAFLQVNKFVVKKISCHGEVPGILKLSNPGPLNYNFTPALVNLFKIYRLFFKIHRAQAYCVCLYPDIYI